MSQSLQDTVEVKPSLVFKTKPNTFDIPAHHLSAAEQHLAQQLGEAPAGHC
jgi:hypothetical protein